MVVMCYLIIKGTPFLVLTGTADESTLKLVTKDLQLRNPVFIFVGPERSNLRFSVKKVKQHEMFKRLSWLIELIRNEGIHFPKTLIFCNTLNDIASVFNNLMLQLGEFAYYPVGKRKPEC